MIDRQLELTEVQRFPPPEPPSDAVAREAERLKMNAGPRLPTLMQSTGLTEQRITDMARDNLRIAGYLDQRFGTSVQVSDEEVAEYCRAHEAEFTSVVWRCRTRTPCRSRGSASPASAAARIVDQWIRDLRSRADVA